MSAQHRPPTSPSNEADRDQSELAADQGAAYARALQAMDEESAAIVHRAGDYLVAFVQEEAEGMDGLEEGRLVWHEPPEEADAHFERAVADGTDGRFVPGLDITLIVSDGERELLRTELPLLWQPFLRHYGINAKVPGEGPYSVYAVIEPPTYLRHDPVNARRYGERVEVEFAGQWFSRGRKPSPDASPRGTSTAVAG
jgi:hypothetical protein